MHHSILALVALVAFAIGSSAAYAGCNRDEVAGTVPKQTVASVDGGTTPILVPTSDGS